MKFLLVAVAIAAAAASTSVLAAAAADGQASNGDHGEALVNDHYQLKDRNVRDFVLPIDPEIADPEMLSGVCPCDFFTVPGSEGQCFKFFPNKHSQMNWTEAKSFCEDYGLRLAKPKDEATANGLRTILAKTYKQKYAWLGARGTGSHVEWEDGTIVPSNSSAWFPQHPGKYATTSYCMRLEAYSYYIYQYPTQPYYMQKCSRTFLNPLCERVCPCGFFTVPGSDGQCFKFFPNWYSQRNWTDAKSFCEDQGLRLAKPKDEATAAALQTILMETYGDYKNPWLGARGTGSPSVEWIYDGTFLYRNSSAWMRTYNSISSHACLEISTISHFIQLYGKKPYTLKACSKTNYPLCQFETKEVPTTTITTTTTTVKTTTVPTTTEATTTTTPVVCSGAYFTVSGSGGQCFKFFNETPMSWTDAKSVCEDNGLLMAKPRNEATAIKLKKVIFETYGSKFAWLGACGSSGRYVVLWDRDGTVLPRNSSAWLPGMPGRLTKTSQCLWLLSHSVYSAPYLASYAYSMRSRSDKYYSYPLCEVETPVATTITTPVSTATEAIATTTPGVCPSDYFTVPGSGDQCFKFFPRFISKWMNWTEAKSFCEDKGLRMAKPNNEATAINLRKMLVEEYGDQSAWLGARSNGTHVVWDRDGTVVPRYSSAWQLGHPGSLHNKINCLLLPSSNSILTKYPTQPYYMALCRYVCYPLCELVR